MAITRLYLRTGETLSETQGTPAATVTGSLNDTAWTEVLAFDITVDDRVIATTFPTNVVFSGLSGLLEYRYRLQQVSSLGDVLTSSAYSATYSTAGTRTDSITLDPPPWDVGEQLRLSIEIQRTGVSGTVSVDVGVENANSWIEADLFVEPLAPNEGSAAFSGVGVLAATGSAPAIAPAEGSASIAGTGVIAATGSAPALLVPEGAASIVGVGALAAVGEAPSVGVQGSATIAGTGAIAATGLVTASGSAPVQGTGVIAATGSAPAPAATAKALRFITDAALAITAADASFAAAGEIWFQWRVSGAWLRDKPPLNSGWVYNGFANSTTPAWGDGTQTRARIDYRIIDRGTVDTNDHVFTYAASRDINNAIVTAQLGVIVGSTFRAAISATEWYTLYARGVPHVQPGHGPVVQIFDSVGNVVFEADPGNGSIQHELDTFTRLLIGSGVSNGMEVDAFAWGSGQLVAGDRWRNPADHGLATRHYLFSEGSGAVAADGDGLGPNLALIGTEGVDYEWIDGDWGGAPAAAEGAATVSGVGVLAATGAVTASGASSVAGTGVLAATGQAPAVGAAEGAATVSGVGVLAATGAVTASGSSSVAGTGVLAAVGSALSVGAGSASVAGTGEIAAAGQAVVAGAASIAGTGVLAATGSAPAVAAATGSAAFSGVGVLTATGEAPAVAAATGSAAFSGVGVLSPVGWAIPPGSVTGFAVVSGSGALLFGGVTVTAGAFEISGHGTITPVGWLPRRYFLGLGRLKLHAEGAVCTLEHDNERGRLSAEGGVTTLTKEE